MSELQEGTKETDQEPKEVFVCKESLERIKDVAQDLLKVNGSELFSRNRNMRISRCRRLIILFCQRYTKYSQKTIAAYLGITQLAVALASSETSKVDELIEVISCRLTFYE